MKKYLNINRTTCDILSTKNFTYLLKETDAHYLFCRIVQFCWNLMAVHGLQNYSVSECVCTCVWVWDYQLTDRCSCALGIWIYANKGILLLDRGGLTAYGGQVNFSQPLLCCFSCEPKGCWHIQSFKHMHRIHRDIYNPPSWIIWAWFVLTILKCT